jgi:pilus assembly protein CpaB
MLKGKMPLVMAAFFAIFAGVLAFGGIKKQEQARQKGWHLKTILVADENLSEGTVVTSDLVALRQIPERFISSSNIGAGDIGVIRNQRILVNVQEGDPLLWSQFSVSKSSERLSTKVLKRMRAFTLKVDNVSSVGGWIRPNDRVDIIGIFKDAQTQENVSITLMQNVMVLATGIITGTTHVALMPESDRRYSEVSLMVLPEDVEQLALAQELGTLILSLRNEEDAEMLSESRKTTIRTLTDSDVQKNLGEKRKSLIEVIPSTVSR